MIDYFVKLTKWTGKQESDSIFAERWLQIAYNWLSLRILFNLSKKVILYP